MAGLVIIVLSLCGHGAVGLVAEYRTCNRKVACSTLTRFTASNLEQVANLLCDQANSASYPQLNGKWAHLMSASGWRPIVWLIGGWCVCTLLPAARIQVSIIADNGMNGWPH